MKLIRILILAVCAAYGAIIGGAGLAQATPLTGLSVAAPAVRSLERPIINAFPVEKTYYYYYRRHYWHPHYYRRHYYHPYYYHRRYYHPYYHRWHRWHRYYW